MAIIGGNGIFPRISELRDIVNVNCPTRADGDMLVWNDTLQLWQCQSPGGGGLTPHALDFHNDVNAPSPSADDFLGFDGTEWIPRPPADLAPLVGSNLDLDDLNNLNVAGASTDDVLTFDGTNWIAQAPSAVGSMIDLGDLSNVDLTGAGVGYFLTTLDGVNWSVVDPVTASVGSLGLGSIGDLGDVNIGSPGAGEDGFAIVWDNGAGEFQLQAVSGGGGATDLNGLTDVTITSAMAMELLRYDGVNWVNVTPSVVAGEIDLAFLQDVMLSGLATDQIIQYDGTNWVNVDLPTAISTTNVTLNDLSNLDVGSAADDDVLQFNTGTGNWEAVSPSVVGSNIGLGDLSNVDLTGVGAGYGLTTLDGITWTVVDPVTAAGSILLISELTDLGDVNAATGPATDGFALTWDNTAGEYQLTDIPIISGVDDIADVDASAPSDDDILQFNNGTGNWEAVAPSTVASTINIDDIGGVGGGAPANGEILIFNTGTGDYEPGAVPGPASLNSTGDVNVPSPGTGQVLTWNGSQWVAQTPSTPIPSGTVLRNSTASSGGSRVLYGSINSTGTIISGSSSGGFSVVKTGIGTYTINYSTSYGLIAPMIVSPGTIGSTTANRHAAVTSFFSSSNVETRNESNTRVDYAFNFMVIGNE